MPTVKQHVPPQNVKLRVEPADGSHPFIGTYGEQTLQSSFPTKPEVYQQGYWQAGEFKRWADPEDNYFVIEETQKEENPKDTVGSTKVPISVVPATVLTELALGLAEGAIKYGKYNWRSVGVRYSIYYDATMRHLISHFEGEDIDPDSGLNHITKAISSLTVLRDAMIQGKWTDDRPMPSKEGNPIIEANRAFKEVQAKHKDCGKHYDRHSIEERKRGT